MAEFVFRDPMCVINLEEHIANILNLHLFKCLACGFSCFSTYSAMKHVQHSHPQRNFKDLIHFKEDFVTDESIWDAFYSLYCSKIAQQLASGTCYINTPPITPVISGIAPVAATSIEKELVLSNTVTSEPTLPANSVQPADSTTNDSDSSITVIGYRPIKSEVTESDPEIIEVPVEPAPQELDDVKPTLADLRCKRLLQTWQKTNNIPEVLESPEKDVLPQTAVDCNKTNSKEDRQRTEKPAKSLCTKVNCGEESLHGVSGAKPNAATQLAKPDPKMDPKKKAAEIKKSTLTNEISSDPPSSSERASSSQGSTTKSKPNTDDTPAGGTQPICSETEAERLRKAIQKVVEQKAARKKKEVCLIQQDADYRRPTGVVESPEKATMKRNSLYDPRNIRCIKQAKLQQEASVTQQQTDMGPKEIPKESHHSPLNTRPQSEKPKSASPVSKPPNVILKSSKDKPLECKKIIEAPPSSEPISPYSSAGSNNSSPSKLGPFTDMNNLMEKLPAEHYLLTKYLPVPIPKPQYFPYPDFTIRYPKELLVDKQTGQYTELQLQLWAEYVKKSVENKLPPIQAREQWLKEHQEYLWSKDRDSDA